MKINKLLNNINKELLRSLFILITSLILFFGMYYIHSEQFISLTDGLIFTFGQNIVPIDNINDFSNKLGLISSLFMILILFRLKKSIYFFYYYLIIFFFLFLLFFPFQFVHDINENF
jgi:hypothetical protein